MPQRRRNAAAYAFAVEESTPKLVTNHTCASSLERCGTAKTVTSTVAVGGCFAASCTHQQPSQRRAETVFHPTTRACTDDVVHT